jgi:hypothetical protein
VLQVTRKQQPEAKEGYLTWMKFLKTFDMRYECY